MAIWLFRNPRFLLLAIAMILTAGGSAWVVLPRMEDPQMVERAANVYTLFPGADAARVESLVTEKIEDALREIDEIKRLRSTSRTGVSLIAIELRDEVQDSGPIWSRIRDKINDVQPFLPADCREPEFDQLDIKAYATLIAVAWNSESSPSMAVLRREAKALEDRLKAVAGTEKIDRFGDPGETIHVEIDPHRVASMGLSVETIAAQLAASDSKDTAGSIRGDSTTLVVQIDEELDTTERVAATPIRVSEEGRFVSLGDVAKIHRGVPDPLNSMVLSAGRKAVILGVMARPDIRLDLWHQELHRALEEYRAGLGSGVAIETIYDQNDYVSERLDSLLSNLGMGAVAIWLVILAMMGWRSALVVVSALPLSALLVVAGLRALDIPIHQMSVTGLILALGLLIDNAIVMADSVHHQLAEGVDGESAIRSSLKKLTLPLAGSTITTALAFTPIALMPGPAGEFVGSIAISVMLAIFGSLLLALTLVPAIAARFAPSKSLQRYHSGWRWLHHGIEIPWLAKLHRNLVGRALRLPALGVAVGLMLPVAGFTVASMLPEQFFPPADRDQLAIEFELPGGTPIEKTAELAERLRLRLEQEPRIQSVHWFIGESAPTFYYNVIPRRKAVSHYAQGLVALDSPEGTREFIRRLQQELNGEFPEARLLVRQLEQGPPFDAPIEVRLFGDDLDRLAELGDQLREILSEFPEVVHTAAELSESQPKLAFSIDEERSRWVGLDHRRVAAQLRLGLDGAPAGTVLEETEEIGVMVRANEPMRSAVTGVEGLALLGGSAPAISSLMPRYEGIPLTSLGAGNLVSETATIPRYDGRRMNEVKAYLVAGTLPAPVLTSFRERLDAAGFRLPPGYSMSFGGEEAERDQAVGNLMANVGIIMVAMVASLVLSFASYRNAMIVGLVGVMSLGLGLGSLWLFGYSFGFMAIVGSMGLIGVAINDSIVILAGIEEDPAAKAGDTDAIVEVVMTGTRHVISTTLTTVAGFLPLVLAGGGFWPPLAVAISGGVGGATLLALYFVPAAYRLRWKRQVIPGEPAMSRT